MKYPSVSRFFHYITQRYQIERKTLACVLDLEMTTIYNFLAGFSSPRRRVLGKLASYLHEEADVFEALCYPPDKKGYHAGIPTFPNMRFDIVTRCDCKWARLEIIRSDYYHAYEAYLAGYGSLLIEDPEPWQNATQYQVLQPDFCHKALKEIEKNDDKREQIFRIFGRWIPYINDQVFFENMPAQLKPVHFFSDPDSLISWKNRGATLNLDEERLIAGYRKLPDYQRIRFKETLKEKLAFTNLNQ